MISPTNFAIFRTIINTSVRLAYMETEVVYPEFVQTLPCASRFFLDGWMGRMPEMRLWNGPRVTNEPAPQTYQVEVKPFEATYAIDRFDLDDDQFGIYYDMLPGMARQARRWPDFQIQAFIENSSPWTGTPQNGLDGLTHWNTAHPVDVYDSTKGTYSNDYTGGGFSWSGHGTVGGAFGPTGVGTAFEYGAQLKGEDNRTLGVRFNRVMHGTDLIQEANVVLTSMYFSPPSWNTFGTGLSGQVGAADNPVKRFGITSLLNDNLTVAGRHYFMDTRQPLKPFRWILNEAPRTVSRLSETDPEVFDRHRFLYGNWGRAAPAWSPAFLSARSGP